MSDVKSRMAKAGMTQVDMILELQKRGYRHSFYFTEVLDNVGDKVQGSEQEPVETREHD